MGIRRIEIELSYILCMDVQLSFRLHAILQQSDTNKHVCMCMYLYEYGHTYTYLFKKKLIDDNASKVQGDKYVFM